MIEPCKVIQLAPILAQRDAWKQAAAYWRWREKYPRWSMFCEDFKIALWQIAHNPWRLTTHLERFGSFDPKDAYCVMRAIGPFRHVQYKGAMFSGRPAA